MPLVLIILALAVYPQAPLDASERAVTRSVAKARLVLDPPDRAIAQRPAGAAVVPSGGGTP